MSTGARAHCCVGHAVPMLAAASSGVGERQGAFKEAKAKMVAWFGTILQRGERARVKQRRWRNAERVRCMPATLDERGHRVNYGIRLS